MKVTVFTPTYNREYIIGNLYESLRKQSFDDFEWVVVDDGSTDGTGELFERWTQEPNEFDIRYEKTPNGGKHRAINRGLCLARGELFFIVDSDDYLMEDSLQRIVEVEATISAADKGAFAGVCGKKGYSLDRDVGTTFEGEFLDITTLQRDEYGISGDKAEVFYTDVLRRYPFPEYENEKFVTECVVWDKIAHDGYKLRFFNDVVYICDYLPDGLSAHYDDMLKGSPKGWGTYVVQSIEYGKLTGPAATSAIYKYYVAYRGELRMSEIAENLKMIPAKLSMLATYKRLRGKAGAVKRMIVKRLERWSLFA